MIEGSPATSFATSALILLVPRQIMLENIAEKKRRGKKEKSSSDETLQSRRKGLLLSSIATFLESNGFWRTLAVFRSEAQFEIEGCKERPLDLEDVICKFLESSNCSAEVKIDGLENHDLRENGFSKKEIGESMCDATEGPIHKKKRTDDADGNAKIEHETQLKVEDGPHTHTVKVLETSQDTAEKLLPVSNVKSKDNKKKKKSKLSEKDIEQAGTEKLQGLAEGKTEEKKKKRTDGADGNAKTEHETQLKVEDGPHTHTVKVQETSQDTAENFLHVPNVKSKDKKKKKKKSKLSEEDIEQTGTEKLQGLPEGKTEDVGPLTENNSSQLDESKVKFKDKKKKKSKLISDLPVEGVDQAGLETFQEEEKFLDLKCLNGKDASHEVPPVEMNPKSKEKKKRKHKSAPESLQAENTEQLDEGKFYDGKEESPAKYDIKQDSNKFDLMEESVPAPENTANAEKKAKKRKRSASTERQTQFDNEVVTNEQSKTESLKEHKETEELQKLDVSLPSNRHHDLGKKQKTEKPQGELNKSSNLSDNEAPNDNEGQKEAKGPEQINGEPEKNEREGDTSSKRSKNKLTTSAEAKTVNAFKRVKIEEVKFADERLQDNSYWAKDGAEIGYGAKAQEILGQVRGRDFRHEKTKKKRGSYRGGQIDFHSHSIKFNYSDEDE